MLANFKHWVIIRVGSCKIFLIKRSENQRSVFRAKTYSVVTNLVESITFVDLYSSVVEHLLMVW